MDGKIEHGSKSCGTNTDCYSDKGIVFVRGAARSLE